MTVKCRGIHDAKSYSEEYPDKGELQGYEPTPMYHQIQAVYWTGFMTMIVVVSPEVS